MRKGMRNAIRSRGRGTVDPKLEKDTIGKRGSVTRKTTKPTGKTAAPPPRNVPSKSITKVSDPKGSSVSKGTMSKLKPSSSKPVPTPKGKSMTPRMEKRMKAEPVKKRTSKYAKGGSVRGTGCATKGIKPAKTY